MPFSTFRAIAEITGESVWKEKDVILKRFSRLIRFV